VSWLYSRALVEAYSGGISSAGKLSVQSSPIHMPQAFWSPGKTTDVCPRFRSGMMCEPLTASRGEELLTLYRADFHAKTSVLLGKGLGLMGSGQVYGERWHELSVRFDPDMSGWKTHRLLWVEVLPEFSVILPQWGMMRDGVVWAQSMQARHTDANESGLWLTPTAMVQVSWPTPRASDGKGAKTATQTTAHRVQNKTANLPEAVVESMRVWATPQARDWKSGHVSAETLAKNSRPLPDQVGGLLNPNWTEWLMGWPIGWTACEPLGMDRFRQWCDLHGAP
jgi:hypothetical protein